MNLRAPATAVLLSCAMAGAAHVAAWTTPGQSALWGLHHAAFFPPWVAICMCLLLLAAILPASAGRITPAFVRLIRSADHIHPALLPACFCGGVLVLFVLFPVRHALLGDADTRLAEVAADRLPDLMLRPHASDTFVRNILHHSVGALFDWTAAQSYAAISSAWGVTLLVAGWHLCGQLTTGTASRWLVFAPLATSGYMLLFFGYIETYSSVAALGVVLLTATVHYTRGAVGPWLPVGLWLILCAHHLLGGLAGACVVLAVIRRHHLDNYLPAWVARRLPAAVGLASGLAAWLFFLLVRPTSAVPLLVPYDHIPYTLLHPAHLADMANFVCLSALPAIVMLAATWLCQSGCQTACPPDAEERDREHDLVLVAAASTAIVMFITNPALGRIDWDLMAMHAPVWVLAGGVCLQRVLRPHPQLLPKAVLAVTAISLFHTAPWIALQQSPDRLVRSVETMVDTDPHTAGSRDLKLGVRLEHLGYAEAASRQYERAIARDPSSALPLYNLARVHDQWGDLDRARQLYERATRIDASLPKVWNNLGAIHLRQQALPEAVRAFERAVALQPEFAGAWNNLGTAYYDLNRFADAAQAYEHATRSAGDRDQVNLDHLYYNLGVAHARAGDYTSAARALEQFVRQQPALPQGFLQLGDAYARTGKRAQARLALQRYVELSNADDPGRERALQYLRQTGDNIP